MKKMDEQRLKEKIKKLENKIKKLKRLSKIDFLTGLCNRRVFSEFLEKICEEAGLGIDRRIQKFQFCLVILDIDDFKKFNDKFGHLYGDKILKKVAKFLKNSVRDFDIVARWGGEEFAIILKDVNLSQAQKRAKIILEKAQKELPVTFSIGVTQNNLQHSPEQIFAKADDALLRAKKQGKNQIVVD